MKESSVDSKELFLILSGSTDFFGLHCSSCATLNGREAAMLSIFRLGSDLRKIRDFCARFHASTEHRGSADAASNLTTAAHLALICFLNDLTELYLSDLSSQLSQLASASSYELPSLLPLLGALDPYARSFSWFSSAIDAPDPLSLLFGTDADAAVCPAVSAVLSSCRGAILKRIVLHAVLPTVCFAIDDARADALHSSTAASRSISCPWLPPSVVATYVDCAALASVAGRVAALDATATDISKALETVGVTNIGAQCPCTSGVSFPCGLTTAAVANLAQSRRPAMAETSRKRCAGTRSSCSVPPIPSSYTVPIRQLRALPILPSNVVTQATTAPMNELTRFAASVSASGASPEAVFKLYPHLLNVKVSLSLTLWNLVRDRALVLLDRLRGFVLCFHGGVWGELLRSGAAPLFTGTVSERLALLSGGSSPSSTSSTRGSPSASSNVARVGPGGKVISAMIRGLTSRPADVSHVASALAIDQAYDPILGCHVARVDDIVNDSILALGAEVAADAYHLASSLPIVGADPFSRAASAPNRPAPVASDKGESSTLWFPSAAATAAGRAQYTANVRVATAGALAQQSLPAEAGVLHAFCPATVRIAVSVSDTFWVPLWCLPEHRSIYSRVTRLNLSLSALSTALVEAWSELRFVASSTNEAFLVIHCLRTFVTTIQHYITQRVLCSSWARMFLRKQHQSKSEDFRSLMGSFRGAVRPASDTSQPAATSWTFANLIEAHVTFVRTMKTDILDILDSDDSLLDCLSCIGRVIDLICEALVDKPEHCGNLGLLWRPVAMDGNSDIAVFSARLKESYVSFKGKRKYVTERNHHSDCDVFLLFGSLYLTLQSLSRADQ